MGGWNYPEDSPGSGAYWNYGPGDYDTGPDPSDYAEDPREQFWSEKQRYYPRGQAPAWQGEDAPSELGWGDIYTDEDEPSWRDIPDPGFPEVEVDTHPDPDAGRDERKFARAATYADSYRRQNALRRAAIGEPPPPAGYSLYAEEHGVPHEESGLVDMPKGYAEYAEAHGVPKEHLKMRGNREDNALSALQDPHYTDYSPEENDWEHQIEYEKEHGCYWPQLGPVGKAR